MASLRSYFELPAPILMLSALVALTCLAGCQKKGEEVGRAPTAKMPKRSQSEGTASKEGRKAGEEQRKPATKPPKVGDPDDDKADKVAAPPPLGTVPKTGIILSPRTASAGDTVKLRRQSGSFAEDVKVRLGDKVVAATRDAEGKVLTFEVPEGAESGLITIVDNGVSTNVAPKLTIE